jgi:hypothetical protein
MEMVKNLALVAVFVVSLAAAGSAQAFGHRGCSSCHAGGCYGGACSIPAGTKTAGTDVPPSTVASTTTPATTAVAPTNSYVSYRRGLLGRRR